MNKSSVAHVVYYSSSDLSCIIVLPVKSGPTPLPLPDPINPVLDTQLTRGIGLRPDIREYPGSGDITTLLSHVEMSRSIINILTV